MLGPDADPKSYTNPCSCCPPSAACCPYPCPACGAPSSAEDDGPAESDTNVGDTADEDEEEDAAGGASSVGVEDDTVENDPIPAGCSADTGPASPPVSVCVKRSKWTFSTRPLYSYLRVERTVSIWRYAIPEKRKRDTKKMGDVQRKGHREKQTPSYRTTREQVPRSLTAHRQVGAMCASILAYGAHRGRHRPRAPPKENVANEAVLRASQKQSIQHRNRLENPAMDRQGAYMRI